MVTKSGCHMVDAPQLAFGQNVAASEVVIVFVILLAGSEKVPEAHYAWIAARYWPRVEDDRERAGDGRRA
jgi:hypothetical protein